MELTHAVKPEAEVLSSVQSYQLCKEASNYQKPPTQRKSYCCLQLKLPMIANSENPITVGETAPTGKLDVLYERYFIASIIHLREPFLTDDVITPFGGRKY